MPISVHCPKCEKTLKVADAAAGTKVRCPACKAVVAVPQQEEEFEQPDEEFETPDEELPAPDQEGYGVTESPKAGKRRDEPASSRKKRAADDDDGGYGIDESDAQERKTRKKKKRRKDDDAYGDMRRKTRQEPHRGVIVLLLGILSIVFSCACLLSWALGYAAMNMAATDLEKMERGSMDPAGQGMTTTGKICGMLGCALALILGLVAVGLNVAELANKK